ncbi:MAG: hypothetical protein INQ03_15710 [Candidatus Heimdallarchaeota archaeon]|nr:hypothetical protein [Candidatus Heimdallarchaeota archaeon]
MRTFFSAIVELIENYLDEIYLTIADIENQVLSGEKIDDYQNLLGSVKILEDTMKNLIGKDSSLPKNPATLEPKVMKALTHTYLLILYLYSNIEIINNIIGYKEMLSNFQSDDFNSFCNLDKVPENQIERVVEGNFQRILISFLKHLKAKMSVEQTSIQLRLEVFLNKLNVLKTGDDLMNLEFSVDYVFMNESITQYTGDESLIFGIGIVTDFNSILKEFVDDNDKLDYIINHLATKYSMDIKSSIAVSIDVLNRFLEG